jgi:hypothetical protein
MSSDDLRKVIEGIVVIVKVSVLTAVRNVSEVAEGKPGRNIQS